MCLLVCRCGRTAHDKECNCREIGKYYCKKCTKDPLWFIDTDEKCYTCKEKNATCLIHFGNKYQPLCQKCASPAKCPMCLKTHIAGHRACWYCGKWD